MRFQNWGEDHFIEYLKEQFPSTGTPIGIGDDCAVIPCENGKAWLVTTDDLVEGVHFLKDQITPKDLGYKTVAVNVSDIAAMGGEPKYAFLSVALPKTTECLWVRAIIDGIKEACNKWDIHLLGGDTVGSKRDVFLNLTLIGSAAQENIKYRSKAQLGDVICVTGHLGDSGGGLKALQQEILHTKESEYLIHSHFHPEPSLKQGIWLAAHPEVHAMMDISDGLDCDLRRLIKSSQKGAIIEIDSIPISTFLSKACAQEGWNAMQLALTGGEDYCLLFTVPSEALDDLQNSYQKVFNAPFFTLGHITDKTNEILYSQKGEIIQMNYQRYDHFQ